MGVSDGVASHPMLAVASALEVIPRTLAQNAGAEVARVITALRSKHAEGCTTHFGIDGNTGEVADMIKAGVLDSFAVKQQCIRSSIESAAMLLRIDQIVSGISRKKVGATQKSSTPQMNQMEKQSFSQNC